MIWLVEVEGSPAQPVTPSLPQPDTAPSKPPVGPLGGDGPVPTDPDGDGRYEDLNGNGRMDLQDPTVFFTYFSWLQSQGNTSAYDFNGNGALDLSDVQALFTEIQS